MKDVDNDTVVKLSNTTDTRVSNYSNDISNDIVSKRYRVVSVTMFVISIGLVFARLVLYVLSSQGITFDSTPYLSDLLFSVFVQIIILFLFVFIWYKFKLKMTCKQVIGFSNINALKRTNVIYSILLGLCVCVVNSGVSIVWNLLLKSFGYKLNTSSDYMPDKFSILLFLLSFTLTAILPAICEEFAIRGGLLSVISVNHDKKNTIIIMAIVFGLFHGYVPQFGYTALMGALLCWLVITTGSLIPAMIVHFINNSTAVIYTYVANYNWLGDSLFESIVNTVEQNSTLLIIMYLLICGLMILFMIAISKYNTRNNHQLLNSLTSFKNLSNSNVASLKTKLRDNIYFIGAIVVTALETIFTFVWGLY